MQSEAYKLTGFTAVASALGFLLRWLQDMRILDAETGLAERGQPISYVVAALIVLMAGVLAAAAFYLKKCAAPEEPEKALAGKSFLYTAVGVVPALLLAAAGLLILFTSWPAGQATVRRLSGVGAIAAAFGTVLVAAGISKPERAGSRRAGMGLLILFGGLWLIAEYKSAAADPVLWRYAVEILAVCAALLAYYYVAGYFFGEPSPRMAVFCCFMGAFLCIMSAVDEHTMAESICYGAAAVQLLTWGYALVMNMRRTGDDLPEDAA